MSEYKYNLKKWFHLHFYPKTNDNAKMVREWLRNQTQYPINDGDIVCGFKYNE